ncbi:hypothetical protein J3R83DRAFT_9327 [Lanmaoa asiatica]|nr:hypothetical protein J3R83DRAFT_9327 [Lanmaoa asiatica]
MPEASRTFARNALDDIRELQTAFKRQPSATGGIDSNIRNAAQHTLDMSQRIHVERNQYAADIPRIVWGGDAALKRLYRAVYDSHNSQMKDWGSWALNMTPHLNRPIISSTAFGTAPGLLLGDGDGGVYWNRYTSPVDIIGYALTHGVADYSANLIYEGESSALKESMSDVFGSMVEQYHLNQTVAAADWLIAAELFTSRVRGVALRSLKAPQDIAILSHSGEMQHTMRFSFTNHRARTSSDTHYHWRCGACPHTGTECTVTRTLIMMTASASVTPTDKRNAVPRSKCIMPESRPVI